MGMKRSILLFLFIGCQAATWLQAQTRHELGVHYHLMAPPGFTDMGPGAAHYEFKQHRGFGIDYRNFIKDWLAIQSGLTYYANQMDISASSSLGPNRPTDIRTESLDILSVPVFLEAHFWKYFFANAGIALDVDLSTHTFRQQTGIGWGTGLGIQYAFKNHIRIYVNPQVRQHASLNFNAKKITPPNTGPDHPHKLTQENIKFGLSYQF